MRRKYVCEVCGYVYNPRTGLPEKNINRGTSFSKLPENWVCPECGASKEKFSVAR